MLGIAKIAELGLVHAAGITGLLLLSGIVVFDSAFGLGVLFTPFVTMLSGAVVVLVVLRHGLNAGLQTIAIAAVIVVAGAALLQYWSVRVPVLMIVAWASAAIAAVVLKRSVRLDMALLATVPVSLVIVLIAGMFREAIVRFWHESLLDGLARLNEQQTKMLEDEGVLETFEVMSELVGLGIGNLSIVIAACALLLGRSWQAKLYNPGGFRKEFHALRLGKPAALLFVAAFALAIITRLPALDAVASVFKFLFVLQGLSVLHSLIAQRGMNKGWLIGIYIFLPQFSFLISALGLADNLVRLRQT